MGQATTMPRVPPLSQQQSPQKSLQRTLSDESLCSGRREPSFANSASLEAGLPSDVLFTSTCAFPSSTLPARRQHQHSHPPGGSSPSTIPASGNGFPEKTCECGYLGAVGGVTPWLESKRDKDWRSPVGYLEVRGKRSLESAEGGNWVTPELQGGLMGRHGVTREARDYWPRLRISRGSLWNLEHPRIGVI